MDGRTETNAHRLTQKMNIDTAQLSSGTGAKVERGDGANGRAEQAWGGWPLAWGTMDGTKTARAGGTDEGAPACMCREGRGDGGGGGWCVHAVRAHGGGTAGRAAVCYNIASNKPNGRSIG